MFVYYCFSQWCCSIEFVWLDAMNYSASVPIAFMAPIEPRCFCGGAGDISTGDSSAGGGAGINGGGAAAAAATVAQVSAPKNFNTICISFLASY